MSPASKSQQKAVAKYENANYDKFLVRTAKGRKAEIQEHAKESDESLNGFVNRAIDETMERDNKKRQGSISTDTEVKAE